LKRRIILALAILAVLPSVTNAIAEDVPIDSGIAVPKINCSPNLGTTIESGKRVRITIDSYTNNSPDPVKIELKTTIGVSKTWTVPRNGGTLERQSWSKKTPPIGKRITINLLYDGKRADGNCGHATAKVVPYFAKCKAVSLKWYRNSTNRTLIRRMGKCLSGQPGISKPWGEVDHVATCESHWSQYSGRSHSYHGVFQLGDAEYRAFSHQGPKWMNIEFNRNGWYVPNGVWIARANIQAALAHAHRYGWGAWSCAP